MVTPLTILGVSPASICNMLGFIMLAGAGAEDEACNEDGVAAADLGPVPCAVISVPGYCNIFLSIPWGIFGTSNSCPVEVWGFAAAAICLLFVFAFELLEDFD